MGDNSAIEWTDTTWNPTTGCDQVSPGCDNCYALTMAARLKAMGQAKYQTDGDPRTSGPGFGLAMHDDVLTQPLRWNKPRRVFVNSMSDLFHPQVTDEFIARVWDVMAATPKHTYQILTKRPKRMRAWLTRCGEWDGYMTHNGEPPPSYGGTGIIVSDMSRWPLPNVWVGTSVEDQQRADERIPSLLHTPAAVRFVSCEPLLGQVDLSSWFDCEHDAATGGLAHDGAAWTCDHCGVVWHDVADPDGAHWSSRRGSFREEVEAGSGLGWVIVGGESGRGARPMALEWARDIVDQCAAAHVPVFVKQLGTHPTDGGRPLYVRDPKGGNPDEWPEPLRVRNWPALEVAVP